MKNLKNTVELTIEEQININGGGDGDFATESGHFAKHAVKYWYSGVATVLSYMTCKD